MPGGPAGFLAVQLSESNTITEGIHAQVIRHASRQQPPATVEVPARRDLLLTGIGGNGEDGHTGGDGQHGMNAIDGQPATREVDATVRLPTSVPCGIYSVTQHVFWRADTGTVWYNWRQWWGVSGSASFAVFAVRL